MSLLYNIFVQDKKTFEVLYASQNIIVIHDTHTHNKTKKKEEHMM